MKNKETLEEAAEIDLTNLCYYDKRNPDCSADDEEIEDHKKGLLKKNKTCSCDNCFYGLTKLTEQLIRQQERMSDESWEGCDGCTEQDEIMYKNGYVKGYNAAIGELPKEISDEEIEEQSWGYREVTKDMEIPPNEDWSNGAKWAREQLKQPKK